MYSGSQCVGAGAFCFPRKFNSSLRLPFQLQLLCIGWSGLTYKVLPTKVANCYVLQNVAIYSVVLLELLPCVQLVALLFLPVVPWPKDSRDIAEQLRLSLLFPL
ncbi:hypothetical protein Plhal304r1_c006g0026331 [Plasmopara halstedii]